MEPGVRSGLPTASSSASFSSSCPRHPRCQGLGEEMRATRRPGRRAGRGGKHRRQESGSGHRSIRRPWADSFAGDRRSQAVRPHATFLVAARAAARRRWAICVGSPPTCVQDAPTHGDPHEENSSSPANGWRGILLRCESASQTRRSRMAVAAAAVRDGAPSLARIAATWFEAVRRVIPSAAAISLSDWPSLSRRSTSRSRGQLKAGGTARIRATQSHRLGHRLLQREGGSGRSGRGEALRPQRRACRLQCSLMPGAVDHEGGNRRRPDPPGARPPPRRRAAPPPPANRAPPPLPRPHRGPGLPPSHHRNRGRPPPPRQSWRAPDASLPGARPEKPARGGRWRC